jgi:hypothetical protein
MAFKKHHHFSVADDGFVDVVPRRRNATGATLNFERTINHGMGPVPHSVKEHIANREQIVYGALTCPMKALRKLCRPGESRS